MEMQVACTNKILIIASLKEKFRKLYIEWNPRAVSMSSEMFATNLGYYLTDAPILDWDYEENLEKAIQAVAPKIFVQELSELGIPKSSWPEIDSYSEFQKYIEVCHRPLIADFGSNQILTNFHKV